MPPSRTGPAVRSEQTTPIDAAQGRARAFARIRQWGDPVLRSRAAEVTEFDGQLERLAAEMVELMDEVGGAGLAAPQVGSLLRLFVYRSERDTPPHVVVNPRLAQTSDDLLHDLEGCLSLGRARVLVEVPRADRVVLDAQRLDGSPVRIEAADDHARVLQHELDHLDGVLMLQRTSPEQRRAALHALRTGQPWRPEPPPAPDDQRGPDSRER